jgi:hypothetical protein
MLARLIDGFSERMQKAVDAQDYEELRMLDSACLRFMSENLPPQQLDEAALLAVKDSLERLQSIYRVAVSNCIAARDAAQTELQSVGRARRNTIQYLDVARNIGG